SQWKVFSLFFLPFFEGYNNEKKKKPGSSLSAPASAKMIFFVSFRIKPGGGGGSINFSTLWYQLMVSRLIRHTHSEN
ncbi:MAG: hypothetical protein QWI73_06830, partial [Alphaproteobacteria bacterium]|nr:hypothetical protein [Alphaproteobacteria bacterium]